MFVYSLSELYTGILSSTLAFVRRGASMARVAGEVAFPAGYRLVVRERVLFDRLPLVIDQYGYEVWRGVEKLYWYDSQPHPNDPALVPTHPHHRHAPPDLKHNRQPAPSLSFSRPNLPVLVSEVLGLVADAGSPERASA